ncbi:MAG TPA: hypothetical protein VK858_03360, partial [Longimicrobiales bacterium]|nr:hypothetical protein [Longimicrobiales bacterium]
MPRSDHAAAAVTLRSTVLLPAILVLAFGRGVAGQTTDTQRAAARDVLAEIESLQARLAPTAAAEALAGRDDATRDVLVARTRAIWDGRMQDLSDWIGRNPEVGWEEDAAVDTLTAVLRSEGWQVEVGVAGLETAFVATWTSPAGPGELVLGLIGEYDALRDADGPFHGDQHNAQTPIVMATAFALAEHMEAEGVPGQLRIYGTPAEEVGPPAKVIMHEAGVFDGADILVRSHGVTRTSRAAAGFGSCCLNINEVKYTF